LWVVSFFTLSVQAQSLPPQVAIIIDDIGYQKVDPDIIRLPYALTFAVMPFTPNGAEMTTLARSLGKEIMLHMPMEAVAQNHLLGKGALRKQMNKQQVQQALHKALDSVPHAIGVNNHMGSLYTSLPQQMDWVMQVVAERQLYFIDSKTTGKSVVAATTDKYGVKSRSRDVFLDNDKSYKALDRQFNQLIVLAKQHGHAVAIGHPYPETYRYLKKNLPRLTQYGIKVVPASALLDLPAAAAAKHVQIGHIAATAQLATDTAVSQPQPKPVPAPPNTVIDSQTVRLEPEIAVLPASNVTAPEHLTSTPKSLQPREISSDFAAESVPEMPPESVQESVQELVPWHPPYLPHLPGFDTPSAQPLIEAGWQRFYPAKPSAATLPQLLFLR
jgi:polysaccharide deacetylase 2 family uncharacterized protein YibQ